MDTVKAGKDMDRCKYLLDLCKVDRSNYLIYKTEIDELIIKCSKHVIDAQKGFVNYCFAVVAILSISFVLGFLILGWLV